MTKQQQMQGEETKPEQNDMLADGACSKETVPARDNGNGMNNDNTEKNNTDLTTVTTMTKKDPKASATKNSNHNTGTKSMSMNKDEQPKMVTKTQVTTMIAFDQIALADGDRLRVDDNPETIEDYEETYRQNMEGNVLTKNPFPACGGYFNEEGKFVPTAGRHRIIAGSNVGLKEFPCIVYPDKESAVWHGLGDNRKNGLRNNTGDLRKMIVIALQQYPGKSHRLIAEHIGCSSSYVDQVAKDCKNQLPTCGQLPSTRTGRDGKHYPTKKASGTANASSGQTQEEPNVKDNQQGDTRAENNLACNGRSVKAPATETGSVNPAPSPAEDAEEETVPTEQLVEPKPVEEAEAPVAAAPVAKPEPLVEPAKETPESPAVLSSNELHKQHTAFFTQEPENDEYRLTFSVNSLRLILVGKFKDDKYRAKLWHQAEDMIKKLRSQS